MSTPLFNIGGLASGLDTASIIEQLMGIERIPIQQMETRKATYESRNAAWSSIKTKLNAVQSAMSALDEKKDWGALAKATSSNPDAVGVAVTGAPTQSSLTFQVTRLATNHQMASGGTYTATTDLVGAGTFSFTIDGESHDVTTTTSTTVADLSKMINDLDGGVSSSVIAVDSGVFKLIMQSDDSGDTSVFTLDAAPASLGTFDVVETGQDAQLTLGSGAGAITVERSSNTIDDLIEGVTLTLTDTTTAAVKITVNRDVDATAEKITAFVNSLNSALTTIGNYTKTASESGTSAGPLSTDATARSLKLSLRGLLSGGVEGLTGKYTTASSVGISLTRQGAITLDSTKLKDALTADFSAVESLFSRQLTSSDTRTSVTRASGEGLEGTHAVSITQAATRATVTGSSYTAPVTDQNFTIDFGSLSAAVTIPAGTSLTDAVGAANTALESASITTLLAYEDGGSLAFRSTKYGSAQSFVVSGDDPWSLVGTYTGTDVNGTIGGITADGNGQSLSGTGALDGLLLSITADASEVAGAGGTLDLGTVTVRSGLAAEFVNFLDEVTGTDGLIDRATDRWDAQIKLADERIEQLEQRLDLREAALRRQYTALETAMGRMSSLSAQLASALQSLPTG